MLIVISRGSFKENDIIDLKTDSVMNYAVNGALFYGMHIVLTWLLPPYFTAIYPYGVYIVYRNMFKMSSDNYNKIKICCAFLNLGV